jgi:hypothetical protein
MSGIKDQAAETAVRKAMRILEDQAKPRNISTVPGMAALFLEGGDQGRVYSAINEMVRRGILITPIQQTQMWVIKE